MNKHFPRIERLPPYVFNVIGELKMAARARGEDVVDLSMGNPDQDTPQHIVDKLIETVQKEGTHRYSQSKGIPRLRRAMANWYKKRYDVDLNPDTEVITTIGSKEGLAHLALATLGPGDAVLVPNPAYPIHPYGFVLAGADIRHVPLTPDVDFFAELEKAIKTSWPKPKMLVLNFPGNPTGQCVELDFFERVVDMAREHEIWVVQDLAYADIAFDGYQPPSILQVEGAREVAVEFFSLSKSYNMPGWRVGFCCGNKDLIHALGRIKSFLITIILPGSLEFSKKLLLEARVAVSPGIGFGEYGDDHVRLALIENDQRTRQALRGIKNMLRKDGHYQGD